MLALYNTVERTCLHQHSRITNMQQDFTSPGYILCPSSNRHIFSLSLEKRHENNDFKNNRSPKYVVPYSL